MRSTLSFGAAAVPQIVNLNASASVDFPLPRGPIMHVRPRGMLMLKPGRNPPLISIFSTSHIGPAYIDRAHVAREHWVLGEHGAPLKLLRVNRNCQFELLIRVPDPHPHLSNSLS